MNLFNLFHRTNTTKRQKVLDREEEVTNLVHNKKNKFTADMIRLKKQTKDIHTSNVKALQKSKELNILIDDIAAQIAEATGAKKRLRYN